MYFAVNLALSFFEILNKYECIKIVTTEKKINVAGKIIRKNCLNVNEYIITPIIKIMIVRKIDLKIKLFIRINFQYGFLQFLYSLQIYN